MLSPARKCWRMLPSRRAALRIGFAASLVRGPTCFVGAVGEVFVLSVPPMRLVVSLKRASLARWVRSLHGSGLEAAASRCTVLGMGIFADWLCEVTTHDYWGQGMDRFSIWF